MTKKELQKQITNLEFRLNKLIIDNKILSETLNNDVSKINKTLEEYFGHIEPFKFVIAEPLIIKGKFQRLLDHLGIEYFEEKEKGFRKKTNNKKQ